MLADKIQKKKLKIFSNIQSVQSGGMFSNIPSLAYCRFKKTNEKEPQKTNKAKNQYSYKIILFIYSKVIR